MSGTNSSQRHRRHLLQTKEVITETDLEQLFAGLRLIGRSPTDGTTRLAWTAELAAAEQWFRAQAEACGLTVERDPAGNMWAVPNTEGPWWAVGSHLDSVRAGGEFDGALGVVCAFAVAARCKTPVAVIAFADEEGARFNTPTFGSRALVGRLNFEDLLDRRDDSGVSLAQALTSAGVDPAEINKAPQWLDQLRGFIELHIDQTRDVASREVPAAVMQSLAARRRIEVTLIGQADHSGTTPPAQRRDALVAAARIIVLASERASDELHITVARIEVEPNTFTTIPAFVRLWVDVRSPRVDLIDEFVAELTGTDSTLEVVSSAEPIEFDQALRDDLRSALAGLSSDSDELICYAGHDAGILAEKIPAAMVFVRNDSGISHAPNEYVSLSDAAVASNAILKVCDQLK